MKLSISRRFVGRKEQALLLGNVSVRTTKRYAVKFVDFPGEIALTPAYKVRDHDELVAWVERGRVAKTAALPPTPMACDLIKLVLERSRFRGQPLHLLALIFMADQTMKQSGQPMATREALIHDTGMKDGRVREVLRDLLASGEAISGHIGGRAAVAHCGIDKAQLLQQPWPRCHGNPSIPASGAAASAPNDDVHLLLGQHRLIRTQEYPGE